MASEEQPRTSACAAAAVAEPALEETRRISAGAAAAVEEHRRISACAAAGEERRSGAACAGAPAAASAGGTCASCEDLRRRLSRGIGVIEALRTRVRELESQLKQQQQLQTAVEASAYSAGHGGAGCRGGYQAAGGGCGGSGAASYERTAELEEERELLRSEVVSLRRQLGAATGGGEVHAAREEIIRLAARNAEQDAELLLIRHSLDETRQKLLRAEAQGLANVAKVKWEQVDALGREAFQVQRLRFDRAREQMEAT
eukprot:TRINITY_DN23524_c0_g1_i1.p1 TRINITY_DN23524_c0_g1~~TRINITY_DN23524_c0_g1_i1.p1  ORF type:complete len:302 (-),score=100.66 TRINITY_DN23524_c0_g1_i1:59-832(-)